MPRKYVRAKPTNIRTKPYKSLETSFWERVNRQACLGDICGCQKELGHCWPWIGSTNGTYGKLHKREEKPYGKTISYYAHRLSYQIHFIAIPQGIYVLHKCDNPLCVNPFHLFLGTQKENIHDMHMKGRENHPIKYPASIIQQIHELRHTGHSYLQIGKLTGVSPQYAHEIVHGEYRKHGFPPITT